MSLKITSGFLGPFPPSNMNFRTLDIVTFITLQEIYSIKMWFIAIILSYVITYLQIKEFQEITCFTRIYLGFCYIRYF